MLGTGGTIASTPGEAGAAPSLGADSLLDAVPELDEYADLRVEQVAQTPSFDAGVETVAAVAAAVGDVSADGVVVTHGTDTMEESAYYLDLTLPADVPVVFTGAQRRPDEPSADGPANLLTAVRTATHDRLRDAGGVYVATDEELHAARDVTKTHTRKLDAFASPDAGPVAAVTREDVRFDREPGSRSRQFDVDPSAPDATVAMVESGLGVGADGIEFGLDRGVDGVVLEGTGLGNATAALGDAVADAIAGGVPVVVTSRCLAGPTVPVYGTPGGGQTLRDHGAIFAGDLPAHKARLKLLVALEATSDLAELRECFASD